MRFEAPNLTHQRWSVTRSLKIPLLQSNSPVYMDFCKAHKQYSYMKRHSYLRYFYQSDVQKINDSIEKVEKINTTFNQSAKKYKSDMDRDTLLYKKYNALYETLIDCAEKVNNALNFMISISIIEKYRNRQKG